ncbi:hypothetical protein VTL71DRAFT_5284 [Oculimacula yallundae]|uniref:Ribosomal protein S16 n=1 Tax=Oculimacula yallundae TaxID=86028 RepID=A0ABR4C0N1_9HELO
MFYFIISILKIGRKKSQTPVLRKAQISLGQREDYYIDKGSRQASGSIDRCVSVFVRVVFSVPVVQGRRSTVVSYRNI